MINKIKKININKLFNVFFMTILSYLLSIYIINDKIDMEVIFKVDIFLFLIILLAVFLLFGFLIIEKKKFYDFIYKKRWMIAFVFLLLFVGGKFNMSSYSLWNTAIQKDIDIPEMKAVIGKPLPIRSDEWMVMSPAFLAQQYNDYEVYNSNARGTETNLFVGVATPVKNILILARPFFILFLILGLDYGFSFLWFGRLIFLFMASFEFFMLLTKKNKKASLIGTFFVTFGAPVLWWGVFDPYLGGEGAIVALYMLLKSKKPLHSILWSLLLTICILIFGFALYPAWMIPLAYIFGTIGLYYIFEHIKNNKKDWKKLFYLLIPISIAIFFVVYFYTSFKTDIGYMMGTVYPGARFETGGSGSSSMSLYTYDLFMAFKDYTNQCEVSAFYAFFPFVFVLSIYYLFKKGIKKNILLVLLLLVTTFFTLFTVFGVPTIIARISLLYMSPPIRLNTILSYLCLILMVMLLGKTDFKLRDKIILVIISLGLSIVNAIYGNSILDIDFGHKLKYIVPIFDTVVIILYLFSTNKKVLTVFAIFVGLFMIGSSFKINPIMKGVSQIYNKPVAAKINEIKNESKDSLWVSFDSITDQNYLLANGVKILNSPHYYPDLELWHKFDPDKKYEEVYNRYAHVIIVPTLEETKFELAAPDVFRAYLTGKDICSLNVEYATGSRNMNEFDVKNVIDYDMIYSEDGINIFKINCKA